MSQLPRVTIDAIEGEVYRGRFEPSSLMREEHWCCLVVAGQGVVWGSFESLESDTQTVAFRAQTDQDLTGLVVGESYVYLDSYWGERAEVVLNRTATWSKTKFLARDAIEYVRDGQRLQTEATDDAPTGGRIVPGAWDHEHCAVCWFTISSEMSGWVSYAFPAHRRVANDEWVCLECYEKYVKPGSLAFVQIGK